MLTLAVGSLALGLQGAPPTFARDFYTGEQTNLILNQGGYDINNGACCSMSHSPNCKIQGQSMGLDLREYGSKNMSRSDSGQGTIIDDYNKGMSMAVVPPGTPGPDGKPLFPNSTHKLVCGVQCPTVGDFTSAVLIGDGQKYAKDQPKDMGAVKVTQPAAIGGVSKVCEQWSWEQTLFGVVTMSAADFYVDMSAKPPAPFFMKTVIEPFGQKMAGANQSFVGFQALGPEIADYFDVDPDSAAACPQPSQGCDDSLSQRSLTGRRPAILDHQRMFKRSVAQVALDEAERALAAGAKADPPSPPMPNVTFANDFTATEDAIMIVNQGGATDKTSGDICCTADAPQCQVQMAHLHGTRYHDVTNQRSRIEDHVAGQVEIAFYDKSIRKDIIVNVTDGVETCQEYCPLAPEDGNLEPFSPFDPFDAVTDLGKDSSQGVEAEHYRWADKIFKIITMQTTDFWAKLSADKKSGVPLFMTTDISPFGQHMGTQNNSWTDWKPGKIDAKKFDIKGLDTCPKSSNCGDSSRQAFRMSIGAHHTYYAHMQAPAKK